MNASRLPARASRGFTLIEVLVVMVIVAILAAVAYPSFQQQVRMGRRADAVDALTRLQQAQERWRANNTTYAANGVLATAWPNGLGQTTTSQGGYYTVAITANSATGYTLTATAVSTKSQQKDTGCTELTMTAAAGGVTYAPTSCWRR